jgi:DNA-directed RNA polymerase specialized sigma24 family protein
MTKARDQITRNGRAASSESLEQKHRALLKNTLETHAEELLWIAEIMSGTRQAAERCIADTIELAEAAQFAGREWILPWIKRLLVHVALRRISGEVRELLSASRSPKPAKSAGIGSRALEPHKLCAVPPQRIIDTCNVLERACFIVSGYLRYPLLDCALLLGCPRDWMEPICERAVAKVIDLTLSTQNQFGDIAPCASAGVTECAG